MTHAIAFLGIVIAMAILSSTDFAKKASNAPAITLSIGAIIGILIASFNLPFLPASWSAFAAEAGLAALGFACAAELRVTHAVFAPS